MSRIAASRTSGIRDSCDSPDGNDGVLWTIEKKEKFTTRIDKTYTGDAFFN